MATLAPRPTTVLRAGPPPRGPLAEKLSAIFGVLLLLATGVMAVVLPVHETLPELYRVSYGTTEGVLPSQTHVFGTSDTERNYQFTFEVPDDDVYEVQIHYRFTDDVAASDPDQFRLQLYDPDGDFVAPTHTVRNVQAKEDPNNPGTFLAVPVNATYSWSRSPLPQDEIVGPKEPSTAAAVEQGISAARHQSTAGTWTLKVVLVAGQCPSPESAAGSGRVEEVRRASACVAESQNPGLPNQPQDSGNPFTVEAFMYRKFTVHVERIQ